MALDDLLISTGVDQLIRLIREKERVEIGAAAKELKLPVRTVEDWSHVLEEEGLITIEYKLTKIYMVWHALAPKQIAKKQEQLHEKAGETKGEIKELLAKVQIGGQELASMQAELARVEKFELITPGEVQKLKLELAALQKRSIVNLKSVSDRFEKLRKKAEGMGETFGAGVKPVDMQKEMTVLRKFEETLQSQLEDTETFFGALEARLEDFRLKITDGGQSEVLSEVKAELDEIKSLRGELVGAIEAVAEEQKSINARIDSSEKKVLQFLEMASSAGSKRKLVELAKMREDAKKQNAVITEQLQSALSSVKKQLAKMAEIDGQQVDSQKKVDSLKDEYVDIYEEIARANGEVAAKQKEISAKISSQMAAIDMVRGGAGSKVSKDEINKVSFLLRELTREQSLLEEKVQLILKEAEIFSIEGKKPATAKAGAASDGEDGQPGAADEADALVEKIKLSQEEEGEFERKRDELRSLIRKMWEENKSDSES